MQKQENVLKFFKIRQNRIVQKKLLNLCYLKIFNLKNFYFIPFQYIFLLPDISFFFWKIYINRLPVKKGYFKIYGDWINLINVFILNYFFYKFYKIVKLLKFKNSFNGVDIKSIYNTRTVKKLFSIFFPRFCDKEKLINNLLTITGIRVRRRWYRFILRLYYDRFLMKKLKKITYWQQVALTSRFKKKRLFPFKKLSKLKSTNKLWEWRRFKMRFRKRHNKRFRKDLKFTRRQLDRFKKKYRCYKKKFLIIFKDYLKIKTYFFFRKNICFFISNSLFFLNLVRSVKPLCQRVFSFRKRHLIKIQKFSQKWIRKKYLSSWIIYNWNDTKLNYYYESKITQIFTFLWFKVDVKRQFEVLNLDKLMFIYFRIFQYFNRTLNLIYKNYYYSCCIKKTRSNSIITIINRIGEVIISYSAGKRKDLRRKKRRKSANSIIFLIKTISRRLIRKKIYFLYNLYLQNNLRGFCKRIRKEFLKDGIRILNYVYVKSRPHGSPRRQKKLRRL